MKNHIYDLAVGVSLGLITLLGSGCSQETKSTLQDIKSYSTQDARTIGDALYPNNSIEAISSSVHDLRYVNIGKAVENLTRIDPSINHQPLADVQRHSAASRDSHNATKDLDQRLNDHDLTVEKIYHAVGLN